MSPISPKGQRISYLGNTTMPSLEDTSSKRVINMRFTEELPLIPHGLLPVSFANHLQNVSSYEYFHKQQPATTLMLLSPL
jgi:hypothetical protein